MLKLYFVRVARFERDATIEDDIRAFGFGRNIPADFLCYPGVQAADMSTTLLTAEREVGWTLAEFRMCTEMKKPVDDEAMRLQAKLISNIGFTET